MAAPKKKFAVVSSAKEATHVPSELESGVLPRAESRARQERALHSELSVNRSDLAPAPIRPEWILKGNPIARALKLSAAEDGNLECMLWDCTAGKFRWRFRCDEIVHVLEGSVHICDETTGAERTLGPGDVAYFPQGSSAVWEVQEYVKKLAILRAPESLTRHALRAFGV